MTRDRAELRSWYRDAMQRRIAELRALREPLRAGGPSAFDEARSVGQALRGSGATFGFPELTAVATLLETAPDVDVLRRAEGLISELHAFSAADGESARFAAEWLFHAAGVDPDEANSDFSDATEAWAHVGRRAGVDATALTAAAADYVGLRTAALEQPRRSALSLVPEALMGTGRVLPLSEDATTITVATADPTSLRMELELLRLTGRKPVFVVAHPDALAAALAGALGQAPPVAEPVRSPAHEMVLQDMAILVVDDESSARTLVKSLLEKKGFEVVEAIDGQDALEKMAEAPSVGLVVADLNMPRLDGLELIWELKDVEKWAHLPIIVVTGEQDEVLETQLIEEGADDYIRKPLDPRLFLARVEATIRRFYG